VSGTQDGPSPALEQLGVGRSCVSRAAVIAGGLRGAGVVDVALTALQAVLEEGVASAVAYARQCVVFGICEALPGLLGGVVAGEHAARVLLCMASMVRRAEQDAAGSLLRAGAGERTLGVLQAAAGEADVAVAGMGAAVSLRNWAPAELQGRLDWPAVRCAALALMAAMPADRGVQLVGCAVLELWAEGAGGQAVAAARAPVAAMRAFAGEREMQLAGLRALETLGGALPAAWADVLAQGGAEAVLAALRAFVDAPADEGLQRMGWKVAEGLAGQGPGAVAQLVGAGVVEVLRGAIGRFSASRGVLGVLGHVAAADAAARAAFVGAGVGPVVLAALPTEAADPAYLRAAFAALAVLAQDRTAAGSLVDEGALTHVFAALRTFPGDAPLVAAACEALTSLIDGQGGPDAAPPIVEDDIKLLVGCLANAAGAGKRDGLAAVSALCAHPALRRSLRGSDADIVILLAMRVPPVDPRLVAMGWAALARLLEGPEGKEVGAKLLLQGATEDLGAAMESFPGHLGVQEAALTALVALCEAQEGAREALVGAGEGVMAALRTHAEAPGLAAAACAAVGALCRCEEGRRRLLEAKFKPVVEAINLHEGHAGVQASGWRALAMLVREDEELWGRVVGQGGCDLVVRAMKAFAGDRDVQVGACMALGCMATCKASELVRGGAADLVAAALRTHGMGDRDAAVPMYAAALGLATGCNAHVLHMMAKSGVCALARACANSWSLPSSNSSQ
jgi:hypothetical protein